SDVQLLQIYRQTNPELHEKLLTQVIPLLDQLLLLHTKTEGGTFKEDEATFKRIQKGLLHSCIKQNKPGKLSDYLWLISDFRMRSLPLINWPPPDNAAKAVILCIHALGLENSAFAIFGRKMADKHFIVYALDVRGFGAWQTEPGNETVNLD